MFSCSQYFRRIELSELLAAVYWLVVGLLVVVFEAKIQNQHGLVGVAFLGTVVVAMLLCTLGSPYVLSRVSYSRRLLVRSTIMFFNFYLAFMCLSFYAVQVHPTSYEAELMAIDNWLFGRPLVEILEPLLVSGVTDFVQVCYATHFLLPFFLLGVLLHNGKLDEAEILIAVYGFVLITLFLGYVVVPARSPYIIAGLPTMNHIVQFREPIPMTALGIAINEWIHSNEIFKFDCFPSGHTQLGMTVIIGSWRLHRKSFPFFLVVGGTLIFATLYLRYHYVIDLVAGALLSWAGWTFVPRWTQIWYQRRNKDANRTTAFNIS
jgi:membrane-associated phospholipid phosphatase